MEPWVRQPGETAKAFVAFCIYRDLGPGRSVIQAYQDYTGKPVSPPLKRNYFHRWVESMKWRERAALYDEYLEKLVRKAEEKALQNTAGKWAKRMQAQREEEWLLAEAMMKRAWEMLEHPLVKTVDHNDGSTTITMPADWKASDIALFLKTASSIARLAVGEDGGSVELGGGKQVMRIGKQSIVF